MKEKTETTAIHKRKARPDAAGSGEVVQFSEEGLPQLDVWLENETVWLTQAQMAVLFDCAVANVNMHLNHIYAEGELEESATIKDFLIVRFEGRRSVARNVKHYNLDAIIYNLMPALPENRKPIGFR